MAHDERSRSRGWLAAGRFGVTAGLMTCLAGVSAEAQGTLAPPPGNVLFLSTTGVGTQNYICAAGASPGTSAFLFTGPQSALSVPLVGRFTIEIADNILAAVPGQATTASPGCTEAADGTRQNCPTWRSPLDQSAVYGTTVASIAAGTSPSCPNAGAVSCLLLKSLANTPGQVTPSVLGAVTYIQRLNTIGGSAPTTACIAGRIEQVPYSATYNFYVTRP